MINMALSASEAKEESVCAPSDPSELPKYPYGLEVQLDDNTLAKLGIDKLPDVGYVMQMTAMVTVTNVRSSQSQGGEAEQSMSLQITDMQLDAPMVDNAARAAKLYGA